MDHALVLLIALLAALIAVALAAPRLRVPLPVALAAAGVAVAFVPGLPSVHLHPSLILLLFLPPLLYADAFDTSWHDFRRWLRPIVMLATGLVVVTTLAVGLVAKAVFPELPWAACFVLGAVLSPTDTVAAQAVIARLRIPRRISAIVGGESLINDATGLVVVQVAAAVALSGVFELGAATWRFAEVTGIGLGVGIAVGSLFALANRVVRDTPILFALSLLSPYLAMLVAEHLHGSGVLAVVVAGLIVAWRIHHVPAEARGTLYDVWTMLAYVLNGFCFLLIGFEAPHWLRQADLGAGTVAGGVAVAAAVMATRILWVFPAAYLPLLSPTLRRREGGYPPWRNVVVVAWCGMRGVISLAAALALPEAVPGRDVIIIATLVTIAATLLVQGLTLEPLVRAFGIAADDDEEGVRGARAAVLEAGIARLDRFCSETSCPIAVHHLRAAMADRLAALRGEDRAERLVAEQRLQVSAAVCEAVREAQSAELLRLRDAARLNDHDWIELQLALDRGELG